MSKPRIAITMGDPAGVGPEICLDLLRNEAVCSTCIPVVFGCEAVLLECSRITGKPFACESICPGDVISCDFPAVLDLANIEMADFQPGTVSEATGRAGYEYIVAAIDSALAGEVQGVTTAPINKEALRSAGVKQPGHTEIFAERMKAEKFCMMQVSDELSCSFVTVHVGYHEVPGLLSVDRILEVIGLTRQAMRSIRGCEPKIVVCGLNPHAGEHGLFGQNEEEKFIIPAIEIARRDGASIEGPLPPDTAFLPWRRQGTDAFVCMYHDQGHIPLKALAFDSAVNTTLGLPVVRTSVDHGTALDIAWQAKASPNSLFEAVSLAAKLAN